MQRFFSFPRNVNEHAARMVAAGVVVMSVTFLAGWTWVLIPLTYGFLARVSNGPRFSPLARFVTEVAIPRLGWRQKVVAGSPKRFAQGIGATLSSAAFVAHFAFGATGLAQILVGMIVVAASLEAGLGFCLGCKMFALLIRARILPESACVECNDLSLRWSNAA